MHQEGGMFLNTHVEFHALWFCSGADYPERGLTKFSFLWLTAPFHRTSTIQSSKNEIQTRQYYYIVGAVLFHVHFLHFEF